jgi:hypothetical protein
MHKLHENHNVARVPFGSDTWSSACCGGNQVSEPEHQQKQLLSVAFSAP